MVYWVEKNFFKRFFFNIYMYMKCIIREETDPSTKFVTAQHITQVKKKPCKILVERKTNLCLQTMTTFSTVRSQTIGTFPTSQFPFAFQHLDICVWLMNWWRFVNFVNFRDNFDRRWSNDCIYPFLSILNYLLNGFLIIWIRCSIIIRLHQYHTMYLTLNNLEKTYMYYIMLLQVYLLVKKLNLHKMFCEHIKQNILK